ncbi:titin [Centropristis striata]|uniref:titin n=1 Tax=Centropristis striata TaxID=184440 RepID=UPI0027E01A73|nr:titin [Centropristis striata]
MWLVRVVSVIYFTAVCAAQVTTDGSSSITSVFDEPSTILPPVSTESTTVYQPLVPNLQLLSGWSDVFPTEKVELDCSIPDSSDWTFTWYRTPNQNPIGTTPGTKLGTTAVSGSYFCKGQHKTSGEFTGPSNIVPLTVYAKVPKPTLTRSSHYDKMFPKETVTFTCKVDVSSGWEYVWYHDGKELQGSSSNTYPIVSIDHRHQGQYHCKGKRGNQQFLTEESDTTTLQVSDPPIPSLIVLTPWLDVFENEEVNFNCEVESDDWTVTWYKDQQQLQVDMSMDRDETYLNITSVAQTHQGVYYCNARHDYRKIISGFSNVANLTVYKKTPTPTVTRVPDFNPMYVGETVSFTCKVYVSSGWEYEWYKDEKKVRQETSENISIPLDLSDQGKYWCKAIRGGITFNSEKKQQHVIEIPVPSLTLITPWLDVFPGEGVKMGCAMQNSSDWTYTWYKGGQQIKADSFVSFDSNGATLSISSASVARAQQFTCQGHLKGRSVNSMFSPGLTLKVHDENPTVKLMQDPEYKVMFPGESVSFSCHINVSTGWEYLWYKDGSQLTASGNKYPISSVGTTDKGSYTCRATRGSGPSFLTDFSQARRLEVEGNKPKPSMTQQPDIDKVYVGESVSFKCKVEHSGWRYHWYKDGRKLLINDSSFNIHDANLADNGSYTCMAIRDKTTYNTEHSDGRILRVSEIPVPALKQETPWLDVFPTESVKLSCDMDGTSEWTYTWFKDRQPPIQADDSVSFDSDKVTLTIKSASAAHRGQYSCSARLKSRSVTSSSSSQLTLDVYDSKPQLTLVQNPTHNVMHTGDSVSFSCQINVSSGWKFVWHKDGRQLDVSGNNHTIASVLRTNTGSYQCGVTRKGNSVFGSDLSKAAKLTVEERPQAHIILLTGWSEVFSTDSLVLKCGVQESQDMWNYTWFKAGERIDRPPSEKHTVTPQDDPEQSLYTCRGIRTGRPSYSTDSHSYKTKNLLLKRRVLLSISGLIFFGIIAVLLGCIVLRVCRKPADDADRPEETELFLTMAQLKDREDAPCPLAQYITDAELNAPSKEADGNGTICSETTPLPITSPEDPAVTSESHDATENNGGLASFKQ